MNPRSTRTSRRCSASSDSRVADEVALGLQEPGCLVLGRPRVPAVPDRVVVDLPRPPPAIPARAGKQSSEPLPRCESTSATVHSVAPLCATGPRRTGSGDELRQLVVVGAQGDDRRIEEVGHVAATRGPRASSRCSLTGRLGGLAAVQDPVDEPVGDRLLRRRGRGRGRCPRAAARRSGRCAGRGSPPSRRAAARSPWPAGRGRAACPGRRSTAGAARPGRAAAPPVARRAAGQQHRAAVAAWPTQVVGTGELTNCIVS